MLPAMLSATCIRRLPVFWIHKESCREIEIIRKTLESLNKRKLLVPLLIAAFQNDVMDWQAIDSISGAYEDETVPMLLNSLKKADIQKVFNFFVGEQQMIVITVPHAASLRDVPRNDIGILLKPTAHYTDWLAEPAARMLHAKLPGSILIVGDVDRRISDLNRRESRETDFRKKVGKIVANANEPVLLLDVHSANTNFFGLADLTIVQPNAASWPDYFLAMLLKGRSNWRRMRSVEGYTTSFLKTMNSSGIPTNMICLAFDH